MHVNIPYNLSLWKRLAFEPEKKAAFERGRTSIQTINFRVPCLVFLGGIIAISHHEINMGKTPFPKDPFVCPKKGITLQS